MTAEPTQKPEGESQTTKPEEKVDLKNLQDKFHSLLDQRNEYNDLAKAAREERDLLNQQRREKSEAIEVHKKARDELNEKMRFHKEARNQYQDQAKAMIGEKRGKTGALERSLPLQVRRLRNEVQELVEQQQTVTLSPAKEKVLVEKIRDKWLELKEKEAELAKQQTVAVDLSDTDNAIDSLFAKADEEHAEVQKYLKDAQAEHEKFVAAVKEIRVLASESDEKHNAHIAYRKKADEFHHKAMELREKVMAVRGERRAEFAARKAEMNEYNARVNRNVMDEKAINKAKDKQLEDLLKKGGKISLGF